MQEFDPYQLALMLLDAVRQLDLNYLITVLHQAHQSCSDADLRWIFKTARLDLTAEQQHWLKQNLTLQEA